MKYICINLYLTNNKLLEQLLANDVLKEDAYNSKTKERFSNSVCYRYIMIPITKYPKTETLDSALSAFSYLHLQFNSLNNMNAIYTLYNKFISISKYQFSIDVIGTFEDSDFDIFYTDGSSSKNVSSEAGYATVRLTGKSNSKSALYCDFVEANETYIEYSGKVQDGTNNIGELTGIKKAVELPTDKKVKVIISDSMYSINSFREWIYNWKMNNYKGANGKQISNCDLIKEINQAILDSSCFYLFKWTKGHADAPFNELCDELAKTAIGLKK